MALKVDLRVGDAIDIHGVMVHLDAKAGQRISLRIEAPNRVPVTLCRRNDTPISFSKEVKKRKLG